MKNILMFVLLMTCGGLASTKAMERTTVESEHPPYTISQSKYEKVEEAWEDIRQMITHWYQKEASWDEKQKKQKIEHFLHCFTNILWRAQYAENKKTYTKKRKKMHALCEGVKNSMYKFIGFDTFLTKVERFLVPQNPMKSETKPETTPKPTLQTEIPAIDNFLQKYGDPKDLHSYEEKCHWIINALYEGLYEGKGAIKKEDLDSISQELNLYFSNNYISNDIFFRTKEILQDKNRDMKKFNVIKNNMVFSLKEKAVLAGGISDDVLKTIDGRSKNLHLFYGTQKESDLFDEIKKESILKDYEKMEVYNKRDIVDAIVKETLEDLDYLLCLSQYSSEENSLCSLINFVEKTGIKEESNLISLKGSPLDTKLLYQRIRNIKDSKTLLSEKFWTQKNQRKMDTATAKMDAAIGKVGESIGMEDLLTPLEFSEKNPSEKIEFINRFFNKKKSIEYFNSKSNDLERVMSLFVLDRCAENPVVSGKLIDELNNHLADVKNKILVDVKNKTEEVLLKIDEANHKENEMKIKTWEDWDAIYGQEEDQEEDYGREVNQ